MTTAYVLRSELPRYGAPANALVSIDTAVQDAVCEEVSRRIDSYVRARYGNDSLPFLVWDTLITSIAARLAVYELLVTRGYNPAAGSDPNIERRYLYAVQECEKIQKQQLHPIVTLQTTQIVAKAQQPTIITSSVVAQGGQTARTRGW